MALRRRPTSRHGGQLQYRKTEIGVPQPKKAYSRVTFFGNATLGLAYESATLGSAVRQLSRMRKASDSHSNGCARIDDGDACGTDDRILRQALDEGIFGTGESRQHVLREFGDRGYAATLLRFFWEMIPNG